MTGGTEVGQEDVGYDPARVFRSLEVKEVAAAVAAISDEDLWSRFDPAKAREYGVYQAPQTAEEENEAKKYALSYLPALRDFLDQQSREDKAMIVWIW